MVFHRVIPCLLLNGGALVKTVQFKKPVYIGDPINTVRIFNEAEVDELVFLDIRATKEGRPPSIDLVKEISRECFMPFAYGGGLSSFDDLRSILANGAEKVILNTAVWNQPDLVSRAADHFGSQSIVASMDVKTSRRGKRQVVVANGRKKTGIDPVAYAVKAAELGAGEILLTSVDREGTYEGYDHDLICEVTAAVDIPVVAHGGARSLDDFRSAVVDGGASAVAAGSMFVFQGAHRAVLINYPDREVIDQLFV